MFFVGIFLHVVFLFSIFDIYFKSPIVQNVIPYQPQHEGLADRLVLFVVDGLRAESFTNYTTMSYLRSIANSHGRWGISHTRVPTESRPGHVAIIAGFYEDPSAVAKGWKENPVDFDSVFNQTKYTWCWGTYDILEIFAKGNLDDHIFIEKFDPYDQTFSTHKDPTLIDGHVFSKFKKFMANAKSDLGLLEKLNQKKVLIFLHLLGSDTAGHTHKPKTQNFLKTVEFVDEGIQKMEKIIRAFYRDDGKTTFLMTSDHGMTDWGSHGAGDPHETETPYVIWGAGVQQIGDEVNPDTLAESHRRDINQADLAPLMSTVLSIPVPVNSIGILKPDILNMTLPNKAKAIYSNMRQLMAQYNRKRLDLETNALSVLYQPYDPLDEKKINEILSFSERLLEAKDYEKLILLSEEIIELSILGLVYYHNYYQRPLVILVTLSFIGWIIYLLKMLSEQKINTSSLQYNTPRKGANIILDVIAISLILILVFLVNVQNLPLQYYIYFCMPVILWWLALTPLELWWNTYSHFKQNGGLGSLSLQVVAYALGSLVLGFSFTYRWILSIPLFAMGLWPFFSSKRKMLAPEILAVWAAGCISLSIFSFMPVIGKDVFIELVVSAGLIWLIIMTVYIRTTLLPLLYAQKEHLKEIVLTGLQYVLLLLSLRNIYVQSRRFEEGTVVSYADQSSAWMTAVIAMTIPFMSCRRMSCRLMTVDTSILIFYLLMSVAHEGLFLVALICNITCWVYIEFRLTNSDNNFKLKDMSFAGEKDNLQNLTTPERALSSQDFRRAFFFILYIILAYFGTGNIASLNSFEVRWVTCFITSYHPFIITALIMLKTLSPFLITACSFRAVQILTKAPMGILNTIVLIYSNIMGIQLLYYVRNTGSWLEIGTSISQFVIVQVITVFIVLINQVAKSLTGANFQAFANTLLKSRKKNV